MKWVKLLLGAAIFVAGNAAYHYMSTYAYNHYHSWLSIASYAVLIATYLLIGLLPSLPPVTKSGTICLIFDIVLLLITVFPFVFPALGKISLFILTKRLYIVSSLLLGYFLKLTLKLRKE